MKRKIKDKNKNKNKINIILKMSESSNSISDSIKFYSCVSLEKYKNFIDNNLKLQKNSTLFNYYHLENFIKLYKTTIENEIHFYKEKLFNLALELKLVDKAEELLNEFKNKFGTNETKIIRMEANLNELNDNLGKSIDTFKKLIKSNQDDRVSLKKYISQIKIKFNLTNIKEYVDYLNEYLKVYMDDVDIWFELSDIYLLTSNYNKAIFCLEEVLLHHPNNYMIYTKIGDILSSFNNTDSTLSSIKYYSQSINIKANLKAFWGLFYALNIMLKYNKSLDEKQEKLMKITKINILNFYANSPMKKNIEEILG